VAPWPQASVLCYAPSYARRLTLPVLSGVLGVKFVGFLLLVAGWFLVLASIALLAQPPVRIAFILAGMGVEVLGGVLAIRSHLQLREGRR
jgi:hypothetical protein